MPSTPSSRLGLTAPLASESANGPDLANALIAQLEAKVGMVKIAEAASPGGAGSAISFTSIPATFRHLRIVGVARAISATFPRLGLRFNNISTAQYNYALLYEADPNTDVGVNRKLMTYIGLGVAANTGRALYTIDIPDYATADNMGLVFSWRGQSTTAEEHTSGSGELNTPGGPVTRVDILDPAGGGLANLSRATLYGLT